MILPNTADETFKRDRGMSVATAQGKLIAVIGDEDTCVGFLLGGIGEVNKKREPNFMVVDKNTSVQEIEDCYKKFMKRDDIDIILINQNIAEQIRHVIDSDNDNPLPAVLEIPSKDHPYDPAKDSVLRRAKVGHGTQFADVLYHFVFTP
ncbi:V-type proton ATPase subunit F [Chionoecetes opilio]|uniref:V-type proton ATPase subunit F n=1 Tax=Chionoecetes opilio TaxID=41210 RepID=A0A8J4YKY0_CHIOP|nr:V-type proton ATPase subunit F [Chionoecetes opilio]